MKLEVEMFVRTDTTGIRKVKIVGQDYVQLDNNIAIPYDNNYPKSSHNIIDLIEVGDFVNGEKVKRVFKGNDKNIYLEIIDHKPQWYKHINNSDIKEVLSKEQYENNVYKLERNDDNE